MSSVEMASPAIDPVLVGIWVALRSISRGLPAPVAVGDGFRVDSGLADETARYVFPAASGTLRRVAEAVFEPLVFLKVMAPDDAVRALLPPRWAMQTTHRMMILPGPMTAGPAPRPDGYALAVEKQGPVQVVRITAADGSLAARGRSVARDGIVTYDQIATAEAHRRRGLGRALMAALESQARRHGETQVLVATEAGRALYQTLGWGDYAPYATAVIPSPAQPG